MWKLVWKVSRPTRGQTYTYRSRVSRMSTPSTQGDTKSIRVTPEIHERLQRLSAGLHNANMNDTIAWLLSPSMVRISLTPEQLEVWKKSAAATGQDVSNF